MGCPVRDRIRAAAAKQAIPHHLVESRAFSSSSRACCLIIPMNASANPFAFGSYPWALVCQTSCPHKVALKGSIKKFTPAVRMDTINFSDRTTDLGHHFEDSLGGVRLTYEQLNIYEARGGRGL